MTMHVADMSAALGEVADHVASGEINVARQLAKQKLPFVPRRRRAKRLDERQMTEIMLRDGFIDRYTGLHVWHPGALRLLSELMPDLLPWHPHWRLDQCHELYWDLSPTIDHVAPLTRGGADTLDNWVTTSGARNAQKSNLSLEHLGWTLRPPGQLQHWDGYLGWFVQAMDERPEMKAVPFLVRWHDAALRILGSQEIDLQTLHSWRGTAVSP